MNNFRYRHGEPLQGCHSTRYLFFVCQTTVLSLPRKLSLRNYSCCTEKKQTTNQTNKTKKNKTNLKNPTKQNHHKTPFQFQLLEHNETFIQQLQLRDGKGEFTPDCKSFGTGWEAGKSKRYSFIGSVKWPCAKHGNPLQFSLEYKKFKR